MLSLCRRKCDFLVLLLAASRVTSTCLKFAVGERKKGVACRVASRGGTSEDGICCTSKSLSICHKQSNRKGVLITIYAAELDNISWVLGCS